MVFLRINAVFVFVVFVFSVNSATTTFSMHNNSRKLCFYLNANRQIESYAGFGMDYYVEPSSFEGKDIIDVLPFSNTDRIKVLEAFNSALKENKIAKAMYGLEGKGYRAKFTPLQNGAAANYFFVTVKEN